MTRREAEKVEGVLADLAAELQILALLPEEFSCWVRDGTVVATARRDANVYLQHCEAHVSRKAREEAEAAKAHRDVTGGLHLSSLTSRDEAEDDEGDSLCSSWPDPARHCDLTHADASGSSSDNSLTPEDEEERQRAVKAACFVHTAAYYGDPTDCDENEAVLQVSDYAQLERDLLEGATTTGSVEAAELQTHHLSTRALVDTMRDGGYGDIMKYFVKHLYSPHYATMTPAPAQGPNATMNLTAAAALAQAYECGMVEESLDHLRGLVVTLRRLLHQRNQSTVNEDIHRYQLLHDAVNRDQAGTADVQVLNQRYLEAKAARQREVAALDQEIQSLEDELQYVQRTADVELEAFHKVQETVQEDRRCMLRQQLEVHRRNADEVARRLQQSQAKALDELNALRSNRTKREAAVSGAITEYDAQSAQLEAAMRQFNTEAEEDSERIVALEEAVQKLNKEREEHAWEMTVAEQRQEHTSVIRQRLEQDAQVIQAYYRSFIARLRAERELEKSSKKRKKKGGAKT